MVAGTQDLLYAIMVVGGAPRSAAVLRVQSCTFARWPKTVLNGCSHECVGLREGKKRHLSSALAKVIAGRSVRRENGRVGGLRGSQNHAGRDGAEADRDIN